jgi:1-acyl-sn-glycerol-3-phosphate acyltransferase
MSTGYKIARLLIRLITNLTIRLEVHGVENLPRTGAYIIAGNHLGRLDVPIIYYVLDREDVILLVAEKYRESAVWRWFVKRLDAIYIDRFQADYRAMRETLSRLRKGGVLVMAPEGTRSPTGALIEGKSGAAFLAAKAGVPVVPAALIGSEDARAKAMLGSFRRVPITVCVGKPFILPPLSGIGREAALEEYTGEIMCQIAALLPPAYRGVYAGHPRTLELVGEEGIQVDRYTE